MFESWQNRTLVCGDVSIAAVMGGAGPPLLLLHGHPQTKAIWHKVAPELAKRYTVVATDLRGYGDSSKPDGAPDHSNYSKRVMAADQVGVMLQLGFESFLVLAHDRGARVAHRMAVDHPSVVRKLVMLDIAPTLAMYEQTSFAFARAYFHWFFLIRPAPLPETLLRADPELYLRRVIGGRSAGLKPFTQEAYADYLRCLRDPATAHGICEDYRASATIDLEHDKADIAAGRKMTTESLVLWGAHGVIEECFDPMKEWAKVATNIRGHSLPGGHYIPEELPDELLADVLPFFDGR